MSRASIRDRALLYAGRRELAAIDEPGFREPDEFEREVIERVDRALDTLALPADEPVQVSERERAGRDAPWGAHTVNAMIEIISGVDRTHPRPVSPEERARALDWTRGSDGRSNTSDAYREACAAVEGIIRSSAHALIAGQAGTVATSIVARLAHVHGLGPK